MIRADRWAPTHGLTLEPNAIDAIKEVKRNLALTAGPGAGKTELLAQRADFLLRTGACRYPKRILAISFKVDASQNLRHRVRKRCGPDLSGRLDSQTFHAFAKRIIDRFRPVLKGVNALDADYSVGLQRIQRKSITFSDMIPLALEIVEKSAVVRAAIRSSYSHVFLDEFQDCTKEQYALILACFLDAPVVITAVGDTKQSIMGWANALDGVFKIFAEDFSAVSRNLYQNHRSAPKLRRMQNAMVKVMDPSAALNGIDIIGDSGNIDTLYYANDEEEADGLADSIKSLIFSENIPPSEIAVLVSRQQNLYCQSIRSAFEKRGIPFREEDSQQDLAAEPVASLIVNFILVVCGNKQTKPYKRLLDIVVFNNGFDEEREYQVRYRWNRFLENMRREIMGSKFDFASLKDIGGLVEKLIEAVGRTNVVALSTSYMQSDRLDQLVQQVVNQVHNLLRRGCDPATALEAFSGERAVRIMSIHKSKGLEFDTVIVLGVEQETFWGKASAERSAFFVGISRAKRQLFLTVCKHRRWPEGASRWDQIRTGHREFLRYAE
ncbi:UvrD-helicase domain-containing protein [Methylorubrum populi]